MNKVYQLIFLLIMLSACQGHHKVAETSPVTQAPKPENLIEEANQAFDNQDYVKAMSLYDKVIDQQTDNLQVIFWASQAANAIKDYDREIDYLLMLKKQDINSIKPRELLVQVYQNTGDVVKRNHEHRQIVQLWKDKKISESAYIRDKFLVGEYGVIVFDHFELSGNVPRKYLFIPQKEKDQYPFVILLSAKFIGSAGHPLYSLDILDGKKHYIHTFYETEPSYDEVRKIASDIIASGDSGFSQISGVPFQVNLKAWLFSGKKPVAMQKSIPYQYAFQLLPQTFFENPERFLSLLDQQGKKYLQSMADGLNEANKNKQQKMNSGVIDHSITKFSGNTIVIIKLPEPSISPEAYFVALVSNKNKPEKYRYFTFEKLSSHASESATESAVLCELAKDGRVNYGIGNTDPVQEDFLTLILGALDESIKPLLKSN